MNTPAAIGSWFNQGRQVQFCLSAFRALAIVTAGTLFAYTGFPDIAFPGGEIVIALIITFFIYKVFHPSLAYRRAWLNYSDLAVDVAACSALPFLTGDLRIPLLCLFLPVLATALFLSLRVTLLVAAFPFLSIIASQYVSGRNSPVSPAAPADNIWSWMPYLAVLLLVAVLPYVMNINVSRRRRLLAVASERRRVSHGIQAGLNETLSQLELQLQNLWNAIALGIDSQQLLCQLDEIADLAGHSYQDVRSAIDQLRASRGEQDFLARVSRQTEDYATRYGINYNIDVGCRLPGLSPLAETELRCVAQEALDGVSKHPGARNVRLSVRNSAGSTTMEIADDAGLPDELDALKRCSLEAMRDRLQSMNGRISVSTGTNRGTLISVEIPRSEPGYDM